MKFEQIVSTVAKNYKKRSINEAKRIEIWTNEVQKLYEEVKDWLNEHIKKQEIIIEYGEFQHYDEDNATATLYLYIGDEDGPCIVFEPTGTNVYDAIGKIDLYLRGHKEDLIYLLLFKEKNEEYNWKMKKNFSNITNFSRDNFEEQISEWLSKWSRFED